MSARNVILFGESGSGKSSIINMLLGDDNAAETSNDASGCTFKSRGFPVNISGGSYTLWDTAGLDEGEAGRIPKSEAVIQLYRLIRSLSGGVSLIIFVMRGPRIRESAPQNWKLFHKVICQEKVPGMILVTGMEDSDPDEWWSRNKKVFESYQMFCKEGACITATRGKMQEKGYMFDNEFEASRVKVQKFIPLCCSSTPWQATPLEWCKLIAREIVEIKSNCFGTKVARRREMVKVFGEATLQLIRDCGMTKKDADEVTDKLKGK